MKNDKVIELPVSNMSVGELEARFRYFARRAKSLCGTILVNGKPQPASSVSGFFEQMAAGLNDPDTTRLRNEFLDKVSKNDPVAREQFCALRLETYRNSLYAQMDWINQYFTVVELASDERPLVQNTFDQEVKCFYVGADGRPKSQKVFKDDVEVALPLRVLSTPIIRYKVVDLYRGSIVDQALKTLHLSRDMANMMESEAFKLIQNNAFGTFIFTGKRATWPYVANSYINISNLPTTNDVTVLNAKGYFDWPVLDEIIDYASRFNGVLAEEAQMEFKPTGRIRLPSSHVRYFGTIAAGSSTPGSMTPAAPLATKPEEEILEKGWIKVYYKGINWVFIPDATLDPTVNKCYPEFTIKPGRVFRKPSLDAEFLRTGAQDRDLFAANEEERGMKTVFNCYFNTARQIYFARFDYTAH
jgi:hypothetical protein